MSEPKIITFGERQVYYDIDHNGNEVEKEVVMGIPQCCREGWQNCPHVIKKDAPRRKKNIGL